MNSSQAQDHLELVDRILAQSDQDVCIGADLFVVWGCVSALIDTIAQLILSGKVSGNWFVVPMAALAAAIIYSIVRSQQMKRSADRKTFMQREYLNVLWLALGVAAIAQLGAFTIFSGWAAGALWTVAATIVTLYIGLHGNRRAIVGGIVLIASLIVANFTPHVTGYVLAAGMLVGYAGFGVAALLARD